MKKILLKDIDTRAAEGVDKEATKKELKRILENIGELQNLLYAERKHSLLVIVQGIDGSGKDGLVKKVFTCMNPQGLNVTSFKEPTAEELAHDFLWRVHMHAPGKGMISIFNRSHYESILITRVHSMIDDKDALHKMRAINDFERLLSVDNNTTVLKFYLHVSHKEQIKRLNERMEKPQKMWKYNANDFKESKLWNKYMECYEDVFQHCSEIPWHIIPADQNWNKSYQVAKIIQETLTGFNMKYPGTKERK